METGRSSSVYSAYSSVRSMPRTSPSELTISVTTRPQPPWRFTRRRNAVSVMPAIGATAKGDASSIDPIFMTGQRQAQRPPGARRAQSAGLGDPCALCALKALVRFHIRSVDLDADALPNQVDREDQSRALRVLPHQAADDAAQRTVNHLHHHAFPDEGTGIVLQFTPNQHPNAVQFLFRNGRGFPIDRHDIDDACALEDRERVGRIEPREAVTGEQRPVDLLLAILPSAPAWNRGKEYVDMLPVELFAHHLLVSRPRPDGEPRRGGIQASSLVEPPAAKRQI